MDCKENFSCLQIGIPEALFSPSFVEIFYVIKYYVGPDDAIRKAGNLGNILTPSDGSPTVLSLENKTVKLIDPQSIIGRSIVVHANKGNCCQGGHKMSLVNRNTGMQLASGAIRICTIS